MSDALTVAVTGATGTVTTARLDRDPATLGWQRTAVTPADVRAATRATAHLERTSPRAGLGL